MERLVLETDWTDLFSDTPPREFLPFYEKRLTGRYQLKLDLEGIQPRIPEGLIAGQKITLLFNRLAWPNIHPVSFDDLPIPFRCVAVDLVSGEEVVFHSGSLALAMRATMSIPSVFHPVRHGDALLVDGGVLNNFPTDVVKDMGADIVIGLNLSLSPGTRDDYRDLLDILDRISDIPRSARLRQSIENCDILID
jgi:NTE family protein